MISSRWALTFAFVVCGTVSQVLAQGPGTQPRPRPPLTQGRPQSSTAQNTAANVPVSKVAVIYSRAFQDPKAGIARFPILVNRLNSEFQKTQDELNQTSQKLKQLQDEIKKLQGSTVVPPAQIQARIDQLSQMKKDYQRKGEDAQAQYQQRRVDLFTPLQDDVSKALDAYAKARGITLIIDGNQIPIVYAAESIDITKAFISDYNIKNPVTAARIAPK